jgi:hypothetical protein
MFFSLQDWLSESRTMYFIRTFPTDSCIIRVVLKSNQYSSRLSEPIVCKTSEIIEWYEQRQSRYNLKLRRVWKTTVAVSEGARESVCVALDIRRENCMRHIIHYLWLVSNHHFFPHYLMNGTSFWKKKVTEPKMYFDFLCHFYPKYFFISENNLARYYHTRAYAFI